MHVSWDILYASSTEGRSALSNQSITISQSNDLLSQQAYLKRKYDNGIIDSHNKESGLLSTLRPRQNGHHFADDTFKHSSWMKILEFQLKFHWSFFLRVQLTIVHHWFRWWLGAGQATSHYLKQWWLDYRRICVSLGLNELTQGRCSSIVRYVIFKHFVLSDI